MTTDKHTTPLQAFEEAKAAHTQSMTNYNDIMSAITRCEQERQVALDEGNEAENDWRARFRKLRGKITDEMKTEHSQRIAKRELAEEFTALIEELELDKLQATIQNSSTGKQYIAAHRQALQEYADTQWQAAMRSLSPTLLRAIKLKLAALSLDDIHVKNAIGYIEPEQTVMNLLNGLLIDTAKRVRLEMEAEPVLSVLGLYSPVLDDVDLSLSSPASLHKLRYEMAEKRRKLKEKRNLA
ncbi:MAG: hypothetical protein WBR21_03060 [Rouxiella badensis]|uniref:hypothetical protein n=1 Tax=Rouxiella badensis TaxID=1646377 RepID=UPI003C4DE103